MSEQIKNTGISAQIIADSVNPAGNRITTYILTFNRWILAELNTHRVFSRNTASSRAIPVEKMIKMAQENPAMPVFWGKNQAGMQSKEELVGNELLNAKEAWLRARDRAVESAKELLACGMHKQYANRAIENFLYVKTILTGTEFENFFALRAHADTQPEFQDLAYKMLDIYQLSEPKKLKEGEWHIPFGDNMNEQRLVDCDAFEKETEGMALGLGGGYKDYISLFKRKIATARCARVSYLNFEGKDDYNKDIELHDILKESGHWSPFEHCAMALSTSEFSGNFKGWKQYRKTFYDENRGDGRVQKFNK
jgi:thymidylate synthase ThyX